MLKRVINCFYAQSYHNKQLVIVYEEIDELTCNFVENLSFDEGLKVIKIDSLRKRSLGELRNIGIVAADGEYVCQWDDDDWFDPDRLETQMRFLKKQGKVACILSRWIIFDACSEKAYLSNRRLWEGSILCKKEIMLKYPYPHISKGEDTIIIENLFNQELLVLIDDMPELYIYIYHGNNTWESSHFKRILNASKELSFEYSLDIKSILLNSL